jgi:cation:H+ antiporter
VSVAVAVPLFVAALAVTLAAAATFARRLDRLGAKYGLPEVWIGLLTALAADGPEVSSALVALIKGAHDTSVGVIVGSNTFNLAAMIGISALIAGCVQVARHTLVLEAAVALAVTAVVIALLVGWLPAVAAVLVIACFVGPYLLLVLGGDQLANRLGLRRLAALVKDRDSVEDESEARAHLTHEFVTHHQIALMAIDIALIVAGSFGMVQAALTLGDRWGIAPGVVGALILGPLTSLPNALTGIRLGRARRGAALVTEALNSNTINLVAGVALPSLFVTLAVKSAKDQLDLALLAVAMVATVALLASRKGMGRAGAGLIVILYAAFIAVTLS